MLTTRSGGIDQVLRAGSAGPRFRRGAAPQTFARLRSPQWLATIGADLALFTALHVASPGSSFNYVALLVLPVLMAGILTYLYYGAGLPAIWPLLLGLLGREQFNQTYGYVP